MSDLIETKVIDNYEEHSQHLVADPKCSTCYNNPPQVMTNDEGYIVCDDKNIVIGDRPVVTEDEWESPTEREWSECKQDKLLEESEQAQRDY